MREAKKNDQVQKVLSNLGENIRRLRLENGWTQETLAEKAFINDKEVSHIEGGRRNITIETLVKIAAALDIQPHRLMKQ